MNQESCPFSLKIHTVVDTYAIHLCVQRDGELSEKFAVFKGTVKFKGPVNDCMYLSDRPPNSVARQNRVSVSSFPLSKLLKQLLAVPYEFLSLSFVPLGHLERVDILPEPIVALRAELQR